MCNVLLRVLWIPLFLYTSFLMLYLCTQCRHVPLKLKFCATNYSESGQCWSASCSYPIAHPIPIPTRGCLPSSVFSLPLISSSSSFKWSWPLFVDESLRTKSLLSSAGGPQQPHCYTVTHASPRWWATSFLPKKKKKHCAKCQNLRNAVIVKDKKNTSVSAVDVHFRVHFLCSSTYECVCVQHTCVCTILFLTENTFKSVYVLWATCSQSAVRFWDFYTCVCWDEAETVGLKFQQLSLALSQSYGQICMWVKCG